MSRPIVPQMKFGEKIKIFQKIKIFEKSQNFQKISKIQIFYTNYQIILIQKKVFKQKDYLNFPRLLEHVLLSTR